MTSDRDNDRLEQIFGTLEQTTDADLVPQVDARISEIESRSSTTPVKVDRLARSSFGAFVDMVLRLFGLRKKAASAREDEK